MLDSRKETAMKKLTAVIITIILLACLTICNISISEEASLTLGESDGKVYRNEYINLGYELNGWHCYTKEEIALVNAKSVNSLPDELKDFIKENKSFILMFAESENKRQNTNIVLTYQEDANTMVEQLGLQTIVASLYDQIVYMQMALGRQDAQVTLIEDAINGETVYGFDISYKDNDQSVYQRGIYQCVNNYIIAITATGDSKEEVENSIHRFFLLDKQEGNNTNGQTEEITNGSTITESGDGNEEVVKIGETITFGKYEQDKNKNNGPEDIEWIVLDIKDGNCLLISKCGLDAKAYNESDSVFNPKETIWEKCSLRKWLNRDFLQEAFFTDEQSLIQITNVNNSVSNGQWDTDGGNDTEDKIFLLSHQEVFEQYPQILKQNECIITPYAISNGAYNRPGKNTDGKLTGCWWLRSPGLSQDSAEYISDYLNLNGKSDIVSTSSNCIRPALWIKMK